MATMTHSRNLMSAEQGHGPNRRNCEGYFAGPSPRRSIPWTDTGGNGAPTGVRVYWWAILLMLVSALECSAAELRPTLAGGYGEIVEGHGALSGALRVQTGSSVFVQAEYLVLKGDKHTDHGPTLQLGLSGRSRVGLRPFIGVGGGPVKGYRGDDGMVYVAFGAAHPVGGNRGAFLQAEFRAGLLGESAYRQFTLGIGVSR